MAYGRIHFYKRKHHKKRGTRCTKANGRLKKGYRWAKGRKGHCVKARHTKKHHRKRRSKASQVAAMWRAHG